MQNYINAGAIFTTSLILYVLLALPLYVIATKTRTENPWMAFIPILNLYLMVQIAGLDWWYLLLLFVPCVNVIVSVFIWWQICEARDKPGVLGLLMLVPCVNVIVPFYVAFAD